jgi:hypothetical protein
MSRRLARSIVYGMGRRQTKLEFRQAFLGHLVDIAARFLWAEAGMIDPSGEGPMVGLQQRGKPPPVDLPSRAQSGGRREEVDDPFVCCQGSPPHHQKE